MTTNTVPAYGVYPVATVRDVAESLGFEKTSDQVCRAIAGDVEFRLSTIIQEAQKFMRHAKRSTMMPSDVEYALQVLNVQPILHPTVPLAKPTFLPVYPPSTLKSLPPSSTNPSGTQTQPQLYYLKDDEIDLAAFLKGAKEVPVKARSGAKSGVTWKAHWLAVEGVQPLIKENPVTQIVDPSTAFAALHNLSHNVRTPHSSTKSALLARTHLSQELQLLFSRLTEALVPDPAIGGLVVKTGAGGVSDGAGDGSLNVQAGPSRRADITANVSDTERARQAALSTLLSDPGLAELLPYLIRWLSENIIQSVTSGPLMLREGKDGLPVASGTATGTARTTVELGYLLDGLEALGDNSSLFVEPYLHQFLPPIMSILLSVPLGGEMDPLSKKFPARDLRAKAAELLGKLMRTYGSDYETLLPRVIKTLNRALATPASSPSTGTRSGPVSALGRYEGALLGLKACGKQAVLSALIRKGGSDMEGGRGETGLKRLEGRLVQLERGEREVLVALVQNTLVFALGDRQARDAADEDVSMDGDELSNSLEDTFGTTFGQALGVLDGSKWGRIVLGAGQ